MPQLQIAHVREQGVDLIIVPLDRSFGYETVQRQNAAQVEIQMAAQSAGLAGTVCPVWDSGGGRMAFLAPQSYHPFLRSISLRHVYHNVNRTLSW